MRRQAGLTLGTALLLAGCATAPRQAAHVEAATPAPVAAGSELLVAEVEAAMARRDSEAALELAQLAVAAAPGDAAPRETLALALQSAGRFDEAVVAWDAALAVGATPRAGLNRALALLAAGRVEGAKAALRALPAGSNAGLGLALAGDPAGLAMLETAAAAPGATATVRQNLALARALAGDWSAARTVALQDLPAAAVPERLSSWAKLASAPPPARVALLLGIVPKVAVGPVLRVAPSRPLPKVRLTSFGSAPDASRWAVQVGAYPTEADAGEAWARLAQLPPLAGRVPSVVQRDGLVKVVVGGFADRGGAQALCARVKAAGADCFVRLSGRSSAA